MHRAQKAAVLCLLAALATPWIPARAAVVREQSVAELVESLKRNRDESKPELIGELASHRSKEAALGLIEVFDAMGSNYMRREVLKALVLFDGVTEAQQPALEKIASVATDFPDREMRMMALDFLAKAPKLGKGFLEKIVESPAEDDVRERALKLHVDLAEDADREWYKKLYDPKLIEEEEKEREKEEKKKGGHKEKEGEERELKLHTLQKLRWTAFGALAPKMEIKELLEAVEDKSGTIRALALEELDRRNEKKVLELAREAFDKLDGTAKLRLAAAQILAKHEGAKVAADMIDVGTKSADAGTPGSLAWGIADILAEMKDPAVDKLVARLIGKGKANELIFAMRAGRYIEDEKITKALRKQLKDKDQLVVSLTIEALGERKDAESLEAFTKMLEKPKDEDIAGAIITAIGKIKGGDAAWEQELKGYAASPIEEVRNAALRQLGASGKSEHLDVLKQALNHEQWSTRFAALRALESMRQPAAIGLIVERMSQESGRMAIEFAATLFRLTGQPYGKSHGNWKAWWEKEGASFEIISESELKKRIEEEEERRLKQRSKASFFGIRIESTRVIFILDVSGSMNEMLRAKYAGETSGETRIDVAKRELQQSIDSLERGALFNIIPFDSDVSRWLDDGIAASTGRTRDEAKEFVQKLGAAGGTNLYGAIEAAFEDPEVDAIYILSDGEPSVGDVIDPQGIRADVQRWNADRGIEIHCVAVGGSLQILEWLAEDHGGSYVKFN